MYEKIKIVILDNHPLMLKVISEIIQKVSDYEFDKSFSDADSLLSYIESVDLSKNKYFALVDLQINNEYSFKLVEYLSKLGILCAIYSMHQDLPFVVKAFRSGARGYIFKSSSESEFLSAIKSIVSGESYIPAQIE